MKTKEFIKSVEALGFQTHVSGKKIKVCDEMRDYGFSAPMFILTPDFPEVYIPSEFYMLSKERLNVLKLIVEYMDTPNSEREEEKRYYLLLNLPLVNNAQRYLNRIKNQNEYYLASKMENRGYQTIFTESEITEMDITGFEKIEVTP